MPAEQPPLIRAGPSMVALPVEISGHTSVRAFLFNFEVNDPTQFSVNADAGRGNPSPLSRMSFVFTPRVDGRENQLRADVLLDLSAAASITIEQANSSGRLVSNAFAITEAGTPVTAPPRYPTLVVAQSGIDTVLWVVGEGVTSVKLVEGDDVAGRTPNEIDRGVYSCDKNVLPWLDPLLTACHLRVLGALSPGYDAQRVRALVQTATGPVLTSAAEVR